MGELPRRLRAEQLSGRDVPGQHHTLAGLLDSTPPQSPSPSVPGSFGPALADHEYVDQMHRTATGGWLLTGSRLLVTDGSSWRTCWTSSNGNLAAPYPVAFLGDETIWLIDGLTLWTSTDGCASWTQSAAPIAYASPFVATGMAFPDQSTGYVAYAYLTGTNQQAQIYRTADDGQHWRVTAGTVKAVAGPNGSIFDGNLTVAFVDADHGWLTDTHTLWTTADGGDTWTRTSTAGTWVGPRPAGLHHDAGCRDRRQRGRRRQVRCDAGHGRGAGPASVLSHRRSRRALDSSSVVADPGTLEISLADPTTWVVLDPSEPASLQTTTDAGATWQTIAVRELWPYNSGPIDFADSLHGWMVVSEPEPPCPQPSGMPGFVICDYAYAPPQHLVATDDGGATWVELKP